MVYFLHITSYPVIKTPEKSTPVFLYAVTLLSDCPFVSKWESACCFFVFYFLFSQLDVDLCSFTVIITLWKWPWLDDISLGRDVTGNVVHSYVGVSVGFIPPLFIKLCWVFQCRFIAAITEQSANLSQSFEFWDPAQGNGEIIAFFCHLRKVTCDIRMWRVPQNSSQDDCGRKWL